MEGQLSEHPLAELIREIADAKLSGALRLAHERVKAVFYFEVGKLLFANSNLRAHRLREVLKRGGFSQLQLDVGAPQAADSEVAETLLRSGQLTAETLASVRASQVADVLRLALLWIDGHWAFDPRVRLADDVRVQIEVDRLLLECARHLPASFVATRLAEANGSCFTTANDAAVKNILPTEAFVLSRACSPLTLSELLALSGIAKPDGERAIYALTLAGYLKHNDWPKALLAASTTAPAKRPRVSASPPATRSPAESEYDAVQELFARVDAAEDHYDVLEIGRMAEIDQIKNAYHALARRYHPDRFHKSEPELRSRVESAFARIAQAYETLSDSSRRAAYDARRSNPARKRQ